MKGIIREYFSWSRSEARSIIAILTILAATMIFKMTINKVNPSPGYIDPQLSDQVKDFISSCEKRTVNDKDYHVSGEGYNDATIRRTINYSKFNPNADSLGKLITAGLRRDIATNIIRYREAGGRFREPEDLKKIYGMNDSLYHVLSAYIITGQPVVKASAGGMNPIKNSDPALTIKIIGLNNADTTDLKLIKGIGSVYAKRIVKYRELLGGFYSYSQLYEIFGLDTLQYCNIIQNTFLDTSGIRQININEVTESGLKSHPYLNAYNARSIMYYRKTAGIIRCLDELTENGVLPAEVYEKCKYYFTPGAGYDNSLDAGVSEK